MSRRARVALAVVLAGGAALRLWQAFGDDGLFFPDEIFQSLEPAHQRAFGYALLPWEFVAGARSWLLPMLLSPLLRLGALVGGDRPRVYLALVRVVLVALSVAAAWGAWWLARRRGADEWPSVVAAALASFVAPLVFFAPRAFSENVCALPIVLALALLADDEPSPRAAVVAASLLGFATLLRVQNGLLCVGAVAWLAARRRVRLAALVVAVLAAWALAGGALDRLTWGAWFHAARLYVRVNVSGYAGLFGHQPPTYYVRALVTSGGAAGVLLLALALVGARRALGVAALVALYLGAHSLVGHKELRFALVVVPPLCALAALGVDELARRSPVAGRVAAVATCAAALWSGLGVRRHTFGQLGAHYLVAARAVDHDGAVDRALLAAHDRADLCGLVLPSDRTLSGGMTWLHRRVPVYGHDDAPPSAARHYNYVITRGANGSASLVPLGFSDCVPDPGYRWRAN